MIREIWILSTTIMSETTVEQKEHRSKIFCGSDLILVAQLFMAQSLPMCIA